MTAAAFLLVHVNAPIDALSAGPFPFPAEVKARDTAAAEIFLSFTVETS